MLRAGTAYARQRAVVDSQSIATTDHIVATSTNLEGMEPFDPTWEFEKLVLELNEVHAPGSVTSGKTRNALIRAWAVCVGRGRAAKEFYDLLRRQRSRAQLARYIRMSPSSLSQFEEFLRTVPEYVRLPESARELREALSGVSNEARRDFIKVAIELLRDPTTLTRMAASDARQISTALSATLRSLDLAVAVDELAELLDGGEAREQVYQDWCDRHSWAFGNAHVARDTVRRLDTGHIVDMLLPDLVGYRDIIELKRPDHDVLSWDPSHKSFYFSSHASKALGQVNNYMDRLHDAARHGLPGHPQIVAFHPRATIVIGRSCGWSTKEPRALRGLNQRLHGVSVMTYDHLLAQARQVLKTIGMP